MAGYEVCNLKGRAQRWGGCVLASGPTEYGEAREVAQRAHNLVGPQRVIGALGRPQRIHQQPDCCGFVASLHTKPRHSVVELRRVPWEACRPEALLHVAVERERCRMVVGGQPLGPVQQLLRPGDR